MKYYNNFYSPELNNYRTIAVWVPPEYEINTEIDYPVFYMHDGNNLFDDKISFSGYSWEAHTAADKLILNNEIDPLIIVGIYNNENRIEEYSPYIDEIHGGGKGEDYLKFIVNRVKPFIDKNYRTNTDREDCYIGGSSLGGLISLYAITKYPGIFSKAAVISPALYWNDYKIIKEILTTEFEYPIDIRLDAGTNEIVEKNGENTFRNLVTDCEKLQAILIKKNIVKSKFTIYPEAGHHEKDWRSRFPEVLQYMCGRKK